MITIDEEKCSGCKKCVDVCPARIFVRKKGEKVPLVDSASFYRCIICGHCTAICPDDAVLHNYIPYETLFPLEKVGIEPKELRNLLLGRRSIRAYKSEIVSQDTIKQLLEAASHAGTASNSQSVEFVIVQNRELLTKLENQVIDALWNQFKKVGNPVLGRVAKFRYSKTQFDTIYRYYQAFKLAIESGHTHGMILRGAPTAILTHTPKADMMGAVNSSLAMANITMMAQTMGLGVCWIGFLLIGTHYSKRISKTLNIPDNRRIHGCIILGYPKHQYERGISRKPPKVQWF